MCTRHRTCSKKIVSLLASYWGSRQASLYPTPHPPSLPPSLPPTLPPSLPPTHPPTHPPTPLLPPESCFVHRDNTALFEVHGMRSKHGEGPKTVWDMFLT